MAHPSSQVAVVRVLTVAADTAAPARPVMAAMAGAPQVAAAGSTDGPAVLISTTSLALAAFQTQHQMAPFTPKQALLTVPKYERQ